VKYLLIDVPIVLTQELRPGALCLALTPAPGVFVASSRFLLVVTLGKGVTDLPQEGEVWDVSLGWHFRPEETWSEELHTPYVLPENVGKSHSKITFRQRIGTLSQGKWFETLLSTVMHSAPRFDRPGGFRGSAGSIEALQYERGVRVGTLTLTKAAADKLKAKVGRPARHRQQMEYLSKLILDDQ
jgi:hypothetical protein